MGRCVHYKQTAHARTSDPQHIQTRHLTAEAFGQHSIVLIQYILPIMSLMRFYHDPLTEIDRLLDNVLATRLRPSISANVRYPSTQRNESKDANTVTATFELPGVTVDDITIDVHQDRLTVASETMKSHSRVVCA